MASSDEEAIFEKDELQTIEEEPATIEEIKPSKGKHKKKMSPERLAQLKENLRKGREKSLLKRQEKKKLKAQDKVVSETISSIEKKPLEKVSKSNNIIDDETKQRIYKEMKKKEDERMEHITLTNDVRDLKEKLAWLMKDVKSSKDKEEKIIIKEEIVELKKEIKTEIKKEKEEVQRPKTPEIPIIEEVKPKQKYFCSVRGTYYM